MVFPDVNCYALFSDLFFELQPLEQVVKQPTRGQNTLDLVLLRGLNLHGDVMHFTPLGDSDHEVLTVRVNCSVFNPALDEFKKFNKADINSIISELDSVAFLKILSGNAAESWTAFETLISSLIDHYVPTARSSQT